MIDLAAAVARMPLVPKSVLEEIRARPEDVADPDSIVDALWASYSAPAGKRDWARLRSLFYPGLGTNMVIRPNSAGGNELRVLANHDAYRQWCHELLAANNLYEWQLGRRIQRSGNTAHVQAAVAVGDEPGKPFGHAVQNILLYSDGKRWWVLTLLIDLVTPDNPFPADLLECI